MSMSASVSISTKVLPGCRSTAWRGCDLKLSEENGAPVLHFQAADITWTRVLRKVHGKISCNLQELEILRWMTERGKIAGTASAVGNSNVQYVPQRRYSCLFPHQADTVHDVFELIPGMTNQELRQVGEKIIQGSCALLCPAPASSCKDMYHRGVSDEVHRLATYWPVRQINIAQEPVANLIDIIPVAICQNNPLRNGCVVFETGIAEGISHQTVIRANMPVGELRDFIRYISRKGRNNPNLAIHDSWHGTISTVAQPAVLECQQRKADTNPTRLYDAYNRVQTLNSSPENYLALSYCWEEWPDNKLLQDKLEGIARRLSIRYFWVDRWCIDQDSVADKAVEIKRMRDYYTGASGCVVLTGPEAKPFRLVPQHDGAILSAYQQIQCNAEALRSLFDCKWVSRVWTLQEALMSRQLIYSVDNQLIDGDYISELVSYIETFSEVYVDDGGNDSEWVGGYGCYGWNPRLPTTIYSRQFRMTGQPSQPTIIRTIFGGRKQYEELRTIHHGLRMPLEEALTMVAGRIATYKEDYIYGILGITERGHEVDVKSGINWLTMLGRLQQAGMITERQLASSTPSVHRGMSWLPECGPSYGPFTCLERLAAFVPRPKIVYSEQGAAVMGTIFEWVEPEYQEFAFLSIHGMACRLVRGKIRFPEIPGLVARVGGISSQPFDKERLSGVQIMLCRDVDNDTKETVAIKVAGDIKGKHVYRQDGYVLELHDWLEGGPSMIKGEEWTVGSTGLSGKCGRCDR